MQVAFFSLFKDFRPVVLRQNQKADGLVQPAGHREKGAITPERTKNGELRLLGSPFTLVLFTHHQPWKQKYSAFLNPPCITFCTAPSFHAGLKIISPCGDCLKKDRLFYEARKIRTLRRVDPELENNGTVSAKLGFIRSNFPRHYAVIQVSLLPE